MARKNNDNSSNNNNSSYGIHDVPGIIEHFSYVSLFNKASVVAKKKTEYCAILYNHSSMKGFCFCSMILMPSLL